MAFVKSRIANAEKEYVEECTKADDVCKGGIERAEERCEATKVAVADRLVSTITDKFI